MKSFPSGKPTVPLLYVKYPQNCNLNPSWWCSLSFSFSKSFCGMFYDILIAQSCNTLNYICNRNLAWEDGDEFQLLKMELLFNSWSIYKMEKIFDPSDQFGAIKLKFLMCNLILSKIFFPFFVRKYIYWMWRVVTYLMDARWPLAPWFLNSKTSILYLISSPLYLSKAIPLFLKEPES